MEANINGFKAASYPCEFDSCPDGSQTTEFAPATEYGNGADFKIDTSQKFTVRTRFFANKNDDDTAGDLAKIETCLIQGENMITIVQDEADYLYQLSTKLQYRMPVVISNYDAGEVNELSGQCTTSCSDSRSKMSNFRWISNDSFVEPEE